MGGVNTIDLTHPPFLAFEVISLKLAAFGSFFFFFFMGICISEED